MRFTLFYSWQSDLPARTNRSLIRSAAEAALAAIGSESSPEDAPRLDSDTQDVPGLPEIARTILEKIESSDAFLADVSFVEGVTCTPSTGGKPRPTPNPNVLIELGYAASTIGWDRIICVMNTDYGEPDLLPFDLKHRRWPIRYSGTWSASKAQSYLSGELQRAVTSIMLSENFSERRDNQPYGIDPLDRIIAHRLRDAIVAARYPIAVYLSQHVDAGRLSQLNSILHSQPSNALGSEFPPPETILPILEVLVRPSVLEECAGPIAPRGVTWIEWMLAGMKSCQERCEETLQRYAARGPSGLIAELEDVQRRMSMALEQLASVASTNPSRIADSFGRSWFKGILLLILRAERTWQRSLTKK